MHCSRIFVAVVGLLTAIGTAMPSTTVSARELEVTAKLVGPDPVHGTPACDPAGRCVLTVAGAAEVTGDLVGGTANAGALMFNSATNTYLTMQYTLFTGTIAGCGTGTMLLRSPEVRGSQRPFSGKIEVILGTGTADLRGVMGSGTYTVAKDGAVYVSVWSLRLHCPQR